MTIKYKVFLVAGLVGLVVIVVAVGLFLRKSHTGVPAGVVAEQGVATGDPVDIVMDFYNPWLQAMRSTSTDPYQSELTALPILSKELKVKLDASKGHATTTPDPVLCQTTVPEKITTRVVFTLADKAQLLTTTKGKPEQSVVTLKHLNNGWYIDDITCSTGESAPVGEFSFDQVGYLLKKVPPPLDSKYWYVVFEENNEKGHFAALFFDKDSVCQSIDGSKATCSPDQFAEASKVHVYGQALETGIEVKRIEFMK